MRVGKNEILAKQVEILTDEVKSIRLQGSACEAEMVQAKRKCRGMKPLQMQWSKVNGNEVVCRILRHIMMRSPYSTGRTLSSELNEMTGNGGENAFLQMGNTDTSETLIHELEKPRENSIAVTMYFQPRRNNNSRISGEYFEP